MEDVSFKLEVFEGPLDLLLHLISQNKVSLDDIPISLILDQYLAYLEAMSSLNMEAMTAITIGQGLPRIPTKSIYQTLH